MSNEYLAQRYGRKPKQARNQRILWIFVGSLLTLAFFAWSISVNFVAPSQLIGDIKNFTVTDELQTKVTLHTTNPTLQDGVCAVQVLSKSYAVVGYKEIAVSGALGKSASIDVAINTTNLGVSATVDRCWLK